MRYLVLCIASLIAFAVQANNLPDEAHVAVTGSASLQVEADQVIIEFQPTAINMSGVLAKQQVDEQIALLLTGLPASGFSLEYLDTVSQSTRPEYEYQNNERILQGVRVTHQLSYRLLDVDSVNVFLDLLLEAEVESISALQYGLQDAQQWRDKVRANAVIDSQQKAYDLAQLYGARLGRVYSVSYLNHYAKPVLARSMAMDEKSTTIKSKSIVLSDTVNAVFLLTP